MIPWIALFAALSFESGPPLGSSWTMRVALGDVDGDGDLDAVEANYGQPSRVWLNDGRGAFTDSGQELGRAASHAVILRDLDGDGDLDAYIANVENQPDSVWLNDGKGRFTSTGQQFPGAGSMCAAAGDLDGDGDLDVVVGRWGAGFEALLNDGKGRFTSTGQKTGATVAAGVALADVDRDGDLDVIAGGWQDANAVWINNGKARFERGQTLEEPGRRVHSGVAAGDLDGDGAVDIVLGFGQGDRLFSVWRNDGKGRFARAQDAPGRGGVNGLALGDLNGDGRLNLVLAGQGPNTVWMNNGRGELADAGLRLGGALSSAVAIGDLNGDARPDLLYADSDPSSATRSAPNAVWLQPAQSGYRVLHHFAGGAADGAGPLGSLVQSGAKLYGMTRVGGVADKGVLFEIKTDGSAFRVLHSFAGPADGQTPYGTPLLSDGALYGMAGSENTAAGGALFRIGTDGSDFRVLHRFAGGDDGKWPYDSLIRSGSTLYGMTVSGGSGEGTGRGGTVFRINTDGADYRVLHRFSGAGGVWSPGNLVLAGETLYGMTYGGGENGGGVLFKVNTDGGGFAVLHHFAAGSGRSHGSLVLSGSTLYGMTTKGGAGGKGAIFKINTDASGFGVLHSFAGGASDGAEPMAGSLTQSGSKLYGMTSRGGAGDNGVVFQIDADGAGFQALHSFSGADGKQPFGALHVSGGVLYGTASAGGTGGRGVVFALDLAGVEIAGEPIGEVILHDAMMLHFHAPRLVSRLKPGRPGVDALIEAGRSAYAVNDYYRAYRLFAKAIALAHGVDQTEAYELAASLDLGVNRAILARGETLVATVHPLFSLGRPLAAKYRVRCWLETLAGAIAGTEREQAVTGIKEYRFEWAVDALPEGTVAIAYRLTSPAGETLSEFKQPVMVAKDAARRIEQLKARLSAVRPGDVSARETIEYAIESLALERSRYDGNWQRLAHPYTTHVSRLNFMVEGRSTPDFPVFVGRLQYPGDLDSVDAATGEMQRAYRASDGALVPYRVFVPQGCDARQKRPLLVALHSGAGETTYFQWESLGAGVPRPNEFKRLAQEKGYIIACPNGRGGFYSEGGSADVMAVVERVAGAYSIDPERVFLAAWSAGSGAAFSVAFRNPGRVKAVAAVAGAATWLNAGNAAKSRDLPVFYAIGDGDQDIAAARRTSALGKELFSRFTYVEYPGVSHGGSWSQALPAVFDFFDTVAGFDYLGQKPPGDEPVVFAPGTVSVDGRNTHAVEFSPDGRLLVFSRYPDGTSYRMVRSEKGWSAAEATSFHGKEVSFDAVSKRLFYYDRGGDLFYVRYSAEGFSAPTPLPPTINTAQAEYYPTVTAKGNLYFSRNGKWDEARIQVSKIEGDGFGQPRDLGEPINIGGASHEFVAPDESYMLFNSPRPGSYTKNDIWVSFRKSDGSWGTPVNLGQRINRDAEAVLCPTVSPDGKYLFFTRLQENRTGHVYWVSARIIDEISRQTVR